MVGRLKMQAGIDTPDRHVATAARTLPSLEEHRDPGADRPLKLSRHHLRSLVLGKNVVSGEHNHGARPGAPRSSLGKSCGSAKLHAVDDT